MGELATRSDEFRRLWASHDVREHRSGIKAVNHPIGGPVQLTYEAMDLSSQRGLQLIAYAAEPVSRSAEALQLLRSWAAAQIASATTLTHNNAPQ